MKVIESLKLGLSKGSIRLLSALIENKEKYCTVSELRLVDKRNMYTVMRDIKKFMELDWIISKEEHSFVGRHKSPVFYTKYKLNLEHPLMRMLSGEMNESPYGL